MAVRLKVVKVKKTAFTFNKTRSFVKQYITNCVNTGSAARLYKNPNISSSFYQEGADASDAITDSINKHALVPTKGNYRKIGVEITAAKLWLADYSDKVQEIANKDENRATREEAAANIRGAYLTPQKLKNSKKGDPKTPEISAKRTGSNSVHTKVINGKDHNPAQTTFIIADVKAVVKISIVKGQLAIEVNGKGLMIVKTASKKAKHIIFSGLITGNDYVIYGYSQNGKKQLSELSAPYFIKM